VNKREPAINGDEQDWTSRWRRVLCVFANNTGLGKKVKRAMNKRERRRAKEPRHMSDDILDTRLAFKPGSGYFGWSLCPGAEVVPDEFDDDWATKEVRATTMSDVMDLLWTYAESGAVVDGNLIAKVGREIERLREQLAATEKDRDEWKAATVFSHDKRVEAAFEGSVYKGKLAEARAALQDIAARGTGIGGAAYVDARTLRDIAKCALAGGGK
jgi:hypothetical protein